MRGRSAWREAQDAQTAYLLGWVGRHDQEQGAYDQARNAFQRELSTMRRVLGERHPDTTIATWNLFQILGAIGEHELAVQLRVNDLLWLLAEDPEQLGAAQRQIAGMVRQMLGGANPG
jgi:hypothetical protein